MHPRLLLVITLIASLPGTALATDAITLSRQIARHAESLFLNRDFETFNELERDYRTNQSRLPDGRWKLTFLYADLGAIDNDADDDTWDTRLALTDAWRQATPDQPAPYLARARILVARAWQARGSGWAHTVSPEQWEVFHERIAQAQQVLEDARPILGENPSYYLQMATIAKAQSWPEVRFNDLYQTALQVAPTYYYMHFTAAEYYLPRWHGSKHELREFVENAVVHSRDREGMTLYTRIYWSQLWALKDDTFAPGHAEWEKMRQGFSDIMRDYPDSVWNLNAYAFYACMAEDWPTTRELLARIGDRLHLRIWRSPERFSRCQTLSRQHHEGA